MFSGKGIVQYNNSWVVAKCDDQLVEFYRHMYWKKNHIKLMRPKYGAHISLVRGKEEGIIKGNWDVNLNGEEVEFYYSNDLVDVINYVWMPVWGEDLLKVRKKLGLGEPIKAFHMTIGRTD